MCVHLPALSLSPSLGQRAEQAGGSPTAHPEPIRNISEHQQERQRHSAGSLCGFVSGEFVAAAAEWNQHTQSWQSEQHCNSLGTRYTPPALPGCRGQKSQEKKTGASQWEDQGFAGLFEE